MGFTPKELAEMTTVPHSSIHKTLVRLREKGLVRKIDSYWAVSEDVAASRIANVISLQEIEATYGDDAYGERDWAEKAPDLGKRLKWHMHRGIGIRRHALQKSNQEPSLLYTIAEDLIGESD